MNKFGKFCVLSGCLGLSLVSTVHSQEKTDIKALTPPHSFTDVFSVATDDPNVLFYKGDESYHSGDYASALSYMLRAAEYQHPQAVDYASFMIVNRLGTIENTDKTIGFLKHFASPTSTSTGDMFSQSFLGDYYRGGNCIWFGNANIENCNTGSSPAEGEQELGTAYMYFDRAAINGDLRAKYITGMMQLLGLGVPRNAVNGIKKLEVIANHEQNGHIAYIVGRAYNDGYWVGQDQTLASTWFRKAYVNNHIGATLALARNIERGVANDQGLDARLQETVSLYQNVAANSLATPTEQANALYQLGMIFNNYPDLRDKAQSYDYLNESLKIGHKTANSYSVQAANWLGHLYEKKSHEQAVEYYEEAIQISQKLPLSEQQRHSSAYQAAANLYALEISSERDDLARNEPMYAQLMNQLRTIKESTVQPDFDNTIFVGYSAYVYPM